MMNQEKRKRNPGFLDGLEGDGGVRCQVSGIEGVRFQVSGVRNSGCRMKIIKPVGANSFAHPGRIYPPASENG